MTRALALLFLCVSIGPVWATSLDVSRPASREDQLPRTAWEAEADGPLWTRVVLTAVETHGRPLLDVVPKDIGQWCPAYPTNGAKKRAAFWAGLISALSRYESTFNPQAVGGGGRWFGLMQISPATAAYRGCRARTGGALTRASGNLNCAVRIMAVTVPRDGAISLKGEGWSGVAADWGPLRDGAKREAMQDFTRRQAYCRRLEDARPVVRP